MDERMEDLDTRILVRELREYAALPKNYEKGWDIVVESWDDTLLLDELGTSRSLPYAKWKIGKVVKTYDDYRADIIGSGDPGAY